MINITTHVKLIGQTKDSLDYTTYIFELLDHDDIDRFGYKYIMCTRWPNWNHRALLNGEEGFLYYSIILAGEDKWYNGNDYTPYKCSTYQFNKFIEIQPKQSNHSFKLI